MIAGGNHTTIKRAKAIIDQVRHGLGAGHARRAVNDRPYEWMTIGCLEFDGDSHTRKENWFGMTRSDDASNSS